MKPRRTPTSTKVFSLPGGNEDNDLWVEEAVADDGTPCLISTWEFDDDERAAIAAGGTIDLIVWGAGTPPVALSVGESLEDRKAGAS